jgi:3-oxoacyl-[acyl-carrier protein] reductase
MDLDLNDKVAIVTGSSRGLGFATARVLAAEGCLVTLCARTEERLREAAREVAAAGGTPLRRSGRRGSGGDRRVLAVAADVSQADGVERIIERTVETFGGIDVLVNNVALAGGTTLLETPDDEWQDAIGQTLMPTVRASRLAVPHMQRRGGGSIVIIASIFGREAGGRMTYNAVKAAQISLGKSLAQQLASSNIRVNTVSPGSILFEGGSWWKRQQQNPEAIADFVRQELPFGRFGRPEEVGDVVAFLASSRASWISGTSVVVDGCQSRAF